MAHYCDGEQVRLPRLGFNAQDAASLLADLPEATPKCDQVAFMSRAMTDSSYRYLEALVTTVKALKYSTILMVGCSDEMFQRVQFLGETRNVNVIRYVRKQHG